MNSHLFENSWLRTGEDGRLPGCGLQDPELRAILVLPHFDRFVYVLSFLDGCTDQECADFLGVSPREIKETRHRVLRDIRKNNPVPEYPCG